MNINVLLLHIQRSDMDNIIKSNLITILDKAIHDGDTVARLEARIKELTDELISYCTAEEKYVTGEKITELEEILHGDKKPDGC